MNAAQRRRALRPLKKEWPQGTRVRVNAGYASGLDGEVMAVSLTGPYPLRVKLDTHLPIRGRLVNEFTLDFEHVTRL